jgi:hypothetical protein
MSPTEIPYVVSRILYFMSSNRWPMPQRTFEILLYCIAITAVAIAGWVFTKKRTLGIAMAVLGAGAATALLSDLLRGVK